MWTDQNIIPIGLFYSNEEQNQNLESGKQLHFFLSKQTKM